MTPDAPVASEDSTPPRRQIPLRFWLALVAVYAITNFVTADLELVEFEWLGLVPFVLAAIFALVVSRIGLRFAIFAVIPLCVTLIALEAGFRIYFHNFATREQKLVMARSETRDLGDGHVYVPHHYSIYTLQPELDLGDGLHHNSLGLRDRREFDADENAIRVVFIGGSTTYTILIRSNDQIFTHGLEQLLNERYAAQLAGRDLQVINAGMGGATSGENLIRMIFTISELNPNLVVIQHGINDGWPRSTGTIRSDYGNYRRIWQKPSPLTDASLAFGATLATLQQTMLGNFVANRLGLAPVWHLYSFTNRPQDGVAEENIARNDTRYFVRNTKFMVALAREMGAQVVLATAPTTSEAGVVDATAREHNVISRELAEELETHFYDFAAEMNMDEEHLPDGVHVSQQGSDLKRDLYFRYLTDSGVVDDLISAGN